MGIVLPTGCTPIWLLAWALGFASTVIGRHDAVHFDHRDAVYLDHRQCDQVNLLADGVRPRGQSGATTPLIVRAIMGITSLLIVLNRTPNKVRQVGVVDGRVYP
jgi:hypothetical protein